MILLPDKIGGFDSKSIFLMTLCDSNDKRK